MKKNIILLIIFAALSGSSCISQIPTIEEYTKHGIGSSIEEKRKTRARPGSYASRIGWKEKTYPLDNGNWVYVEPDSKNCYIHWEVTPQGIIVGYKLEGKCY
jgi:hypothetical protein